MGRQNVKTIKALHAGPPQDGFQAWNLSDFNEFDLNSSLKLRWLPTTLNIVSVTFSDKKKKWEQSFSWFSCLMNSGGSVSVSRRSSFGITCTDPGFGLWLRWKKTQTRQRKPPARCLILDCWRWSVRNGAAAEVRTALRLELAMHLFCQMNPRSTGSASAWRTITFRLMAARDPSINARGFEARWRVAG